MNNLSPTKACRNCPCIYPATTQFFAANGKYLASYCRTCHVEIAKQARRGDPTPIQIEILKTKIRREKIASMRGARW